MERSISILFELIRISLGFQTRLSYLPDENEWRRVFQESKKQAVVGIVFEGVKKLPLDQRPPQTIIFEWISISEQIHFLNKRLNTSLKEVAELLMKNRVNYIVVKGQAVASYYDYPNSRVTGDIDFYCPSDSFEAANNLITSKWGVEIIKEESQYHYSFSYNEVDFELHYNLYNAYNSKRNIYWKRLLDEVPGSQVVIEESSINTLDSTVHALYIFLHLYNHLIQLGVGLKQFLDLAMVLQHGNINKKRLADYLHCMGMNRAFCACSYILKNYIGIPSEALPFVVNKADKKYGQRILGIILYRGNMGHYHRSSIKDGAIGHLLKAIGIKMSHLLKFFWLSPTYHLGWISSRCKKIIFNKI